MADTVKSNKSVDENGTTVDTTINPSIRLFTGRTLQNQTSFTCYINHLYLKNFYHFMYCVEKSVNLEISLKHEKLILVLKELYFSHVISDHGFMSYRFDCYEKPTSSTFLKCQTYLLQSRSALIYVTECNSDDFRNYFRVPTVYLTSRMPCRIKTTMHLDIHQNGYGGICRTSHDCKDNLLCRHINCKCQDDHVIHVKGQNSTCLRKKYLFDKCRIDLQCQSSIENCYCGENHRCQCKEGYIAVDNGMLSCFKELGLGDHCRFSAQCKTKRGYSSECNNGYCTCETGFVNVDGLCEMRIKASSSTKTVTAIGIVCFFVTLIGLTVLIIKCAQSLECCSRRLRSGITPSDNQPETFYVPPPLYDKPPSFEEALEMSQMFDQGLNGDDDVTDAGKTSRTERSTGIHNEDTIEQSENRDLKIVSGNHKTGLRGATCPTTGSKNGSVIQSTSS
ncbi:Uncharacterised protein g1789 [Pycnogonum litorale]